MDKLLPCPFCGGEAKIVTELNGWYAIFHKGDNDCPIRCEDDTVGDLEYETEGELITAWNRRTAPQKEEEKG